MSEKEADRLVKLAQMLKARIYTDDNDEYNTATARGAAIKAGFARDNEEADRFLKKNNLYNGSNQLTDKQLQQLAEMIEIRADKIDDGKINHSLKDNRNRVGYDWRWGAGGDSFNVSSIENLPDNLTPQNNLPNLKGKVIDNGKS